MPRTTLAVPEFKKPVSARPEQCVGVLRVPSSRFRGWGYGGVWVWRIDAAKWHGEASGTSFVYLFSVHCLSVAD